jgi:hypothetical protein
MVKYTPETRRTKGLIPASVPLNCRFPTFCRSNTYALLVEAYWENGCSKQRVIANLGRKDLLAPHRR